MSCWTYLETLPPAIAPSAITNGGLFHTATRTIRWGPFSDTTARTFSYTATGRAGIHAVRGAWCVDGYGTLEPNPRSVTVAESGTPAQNYLRRGRRSYDSRSRRLA